MINYGILYHIIYTRKYFYFHSCVGLKTHYKTDRNIHHLLQTELCHDQEYNFQNQTANFLHLDVLINMNFLRGTLGKMADVIIEYDTEFMCVR